MAGVYTGWSNNNKSNTKIDLLGYDRHKND